MGVLLLSCPPIDDLTCIGTVTYTETYSTQGSIPVSSGIGTFNASQALLWKPSWLAYLFTCASFNLLFDTTSSVTIDPPHCYGTPCSTYFFTGGIAFVYPTLYNRTSLFPNADVIVVRQSRGLLVSYWDLNSAEANSISPSDVECAIFGAKNEAFQICLAPSSLNVDHVVAGFTPIVKTNKRVDLLSLRGSKE